MNVAKLVLLLPLWLMIRIQSSPTPSLSLPHFLISHTQNYGNDPIDDIPPKEYYEVTLPLPTDQATPACSVNVLTYTFGDTSDSPTSPPTCSPPTSSPPSAPPTSSPPTSSPPASTPPTISPPASTPPTSSPPTSAPPTSSPPTIAPPTSSPPTSSPPSAPPTSSPPTSSPPTSTPPTISPPTSTPPTSSPPTSAPPTSSPPTIAPPTSSPPTSSPPSAPPTSSPPTSSPPMSTPPTISPPTIPPPMSSPPTSTPPTSSPPTSTPPMTSPPTIAPPTSSPPTSSPPSAPPTSSPPTSSPPTSTPPTISPPTIPPPMSSPPAIAPPTSSPPTSSPPSAPPTSSPPTSSPPTSTPPTISPPTIPPPMSRPPTSTPPTSSPPTSTPPMSSPPTITPPMISPPTSNPPTSIPPTIAPPTSTPPMSSPPTIPPPTSSPPMGMPPTSISPTSTPPMSSPPTSTPPTSSPPMGMPPTSAPPESSPPTSSPPTSISPTSSAPTSAPSISTPPTSSPPTSIPPTIAPPMSSAPTSTPPRSSPPMSSPLRSSVPTSSRLISDGFGNTFGNPSISVIYTPPPVTCAWSHAVLEYHAEYKGEQYGSIAGVWIDGVELLRTSTAQPTEDGVLWNVRKDVTRYSSILSRENLTLSVMLGNIGNGEFTGVYRVNVSFLFYSDKALRLPSSVVWRESEAQTLNRKLISVNAAKLELDRVIQSLYPYDTPADLIVPMSGGVDEGYWSKIEDEFDVRTTNVQLSPKTYKAVLELYISFHDNDEFWYMNPSDSYIEANHLPTGRGHGAYREILVTIDGKLVGTVIPFPVIFPSGINPLFWSPVVSIGAFDLPSYDIDLTPFLGLLLDNKKHSIGIQVADGISFWLVGANLHLWSGHSNVKAQTVKFDFPSMDVHRHNNFEQLDGELELEGERSSEATGWVNSSAGYLKTYLTEETKFKNKLKFKKQGTKKDLYHRTTKRTKIKIKDAKGHLIFGLEFKTTYPLKINIVTQPGSDAHTSVITTKVVQEQERTEKFSGDSRVLKHSQNCDGSMLVKDHFVLSNSAENHQTYNYRDRFGCYSRKVDVVDGDVVADDTSSKCA